MIGFPQRGERFEPVVLMMHGYMGGIPRRRGSEFFAGRQFDVFNIVDRNNSLPRLCVEQFVTRSAPPAPWAHGLSDDGLGGNDRCWISRSTALIC
jgi:hypothetical protein